MALLQISEPGDASAPHQRRLAVGIDLGTTHTLVAAVRSGVSEVLADEQGRLLTPSVVHYPADGERRVGHAALDGRAADAANTVVSVKRLLGRSLDEARREAGAYIYDDDPQRVALRTAQGSYTPVEISAHILAAVREQAEATLGGELVGAVITVPAYFDDAQRQATRDAARLAGLSVLRLLNEPTAAAVAYGLDRGSEGIYAVYDLGGGTFDLSVLKLRQGVFEVLATGGDTRLGGDDFDTAMVMQCLPQAQWDSLGANDRRALLTAARSAREALSSQEQAGLDLTLQDGRQVQCTWTRSGFDALARPLVGRTLDCARRTLRDAGLDPAQVQGVVMVGGATRMPVVRTAVQELFGQPPLTDLDPDQVVALGAALQANLLAGNRAPGGDWLLLDVTPLSLGLEIMGGMVERIIPRNSTIPVARGQEFTTYKDGQTAMSVHVVQGERDMVADCRSLARFELRGIPPMAAGAARIRVTFQIDADGLLHVSAREATTGVEAAVAVQPSYGLSDDDMARMLAAGMAHADDDARARALREQQVELERLLLAVQSALQADGDLLDAGQRAGIDRVLTQATEALAQADGSGLRQASLALSAATDDFAARRMDRSIRAALSGRSLDELAD